ncbi:MAG: leucine-rich repeat protein, partial [Clostridia bacterium]|nr:leucine-rich repeat protein [Clostridia bacterium]
MKQKLWITLVIVVLMTALCCGIAAAEIVDSGTFDGGGEWTFDDNGVLTISGTAHTSSRPLDSELREAITQVVLGPDVEEVASYTFSGAKKLALFVVDPANQNYTAVDGVLYSKDMTRLVRMPSAITGSFTIPASVTSLAADAFIASSLTEIIFPEGLTEIPDHCLYWCQSMTTVRLPSTLLFIGYAAFEDCDSLTNIYYSGTCSNWQNEVNISEINDYLLLNPIHCTDGDCPAQSVTGSCGTNVTFVLTPEGTLTVSGAGEWNGWAFESDPFIKRVILEPGVTEIGDGAFYWSTNISEITIPDTVTKIGYEAIYACHLLTSITIPASVTEIENEAFNGCNNLKEVHFGGTMAAWNSMVSTDRDHYILTKRPIYCSDGIISVVQPASGTFDDGLAWDLDGTGKLTISGNGRFDDFLDYDIRQQITTVCFGAGITYIEPGRFSYSYDLIAFEVDADNPYYTAVDGVLYTKNMTELVECPTAKSGSLVIPDTVTIICHDAFIGSYLSSITLSANLETIGYQAFWNSSLTEITLPAGYSGYDSSVFNGSDRLTAFYVASDNPEFTAVDGLLYSKDMSTLIRVPGGYSGSLVISGETTHHIGEGAFQRCKELTSVTLSEGIETIEPSAFSGSGIKTVNLPLSLATINDSAFKNADALTTVNYSGTTADWSNVSILGNNNSLLFCTIHCQDGDAEPKPVSTSIGDGITYTLTPEGVLTITGGGVWNDWAFDSNQSIVQAILEPGVTEIGWGGLAWCQSLQSISIPDSVTEIKYEAFYYCSSLEAITIPASVTVFGDRVFDGCDNLTEITFGGTTEEWAA